MGSRGHPRSQGHRPPSVSGGSWVHVAVGNARPSLARPGCEIPSSASPPQRPGSSWPRPSSAGGPPFGARSPRRRETTAGRMTSPAHSPGASGPRVTKRVHERGPSAAPRGPWPRRARSPKPHHHLRCTRSAIQRPATPSGAARGPIETTPPLGAGPRGSTRAATSATRATEIWRTRKKRPTRRTSTGRATRRRRRGARGRARPAAGRARAGRRSAKVRFANRYIHSTSCDAPGASRSSPRSPFHVISATLAFAPSQARHPPARSTAPRRTT